jgi:transposase
LLTDPTDCHPSRAQSMSRARLFGDRAFALSAGLHADDLALRLAISERISVREELWVRATASAVEIFHLGGRVTCDVRSYVRNGRTTKPEHMPSTHRAHAEWTPSRILGWAETLGPNTRAFCEAILHERRHPEWGYRSCLGLFRLAKKYGEARVEAASARALFGGARSYRYRSSEMTIATRSMRR